MEQAVTKKGLNLLFEEDILLTDYVEYGFSLQDLVGGRPLPPEGARFDISFEGSLTGDRIKGTIKGVDYLEVRADGRFFLNLYARITTDDGAKILVEESGTNDHGDLKLQMRFHTNDERYAWLNQEQVMGLGRADFATGKASVKGYSL